MRGKIWTRLVVVAGLVTPGVWDGAVGSKNLLLAVSKTLANHAWTKDEGGSRRKHKNNLHRQSESLVPAHIRVAPAGRPDDGRAAVPEGPGAVAAALARRRRRRRFE